MGTNAVPVLIEVLGYQPEKMEEWYERAYVNAPASLRKQMSKPDAIARLRDQAAHALFNMPETKLYLHELLPLMQDLRPEVRRAVSSLFLQHAARAPQSLRLELLPFLKDSDPEVRKHIMWAFSSPDTLLPRAKAAFEAALMDPVDEVRVTASRVLLQQEKEHSAALKTLKLLLNSTNGWTKLTAATTYLSTQQDSPNLDREVGPVFNSILTNTLPEHAQWRFMALIHLQDYRKPLKSTIPELQKLLTNSILSIRTEASNTLRIVAPEALPKKP
ncbi:MAG: HEAT repeat domain-containing protein [Verrucomicrobiota bacterium]